MTTYCLWLNSRVSFFSSLVELRKAIIRDDDDTREYKIARYTELRYAMYKNSRGWVFDDFKKSKVYFVNRDGTLRKGKQY